MAASVDGFQRGWGNFVEVRPISGHDGCMGLHVSQNANAGKDNSSGCCHLWPMCLCGFPGSPGWPLQVQYAID